MGQQAVPNTFIRGLDHYQFYALPVKKNLQTIREHLGDALLYVHLFLMEKNVIEPNRMKSLQYGLTLDLMPHLIALLSYFGSISTIDEISVLKASQYSPLDIRYESETASFVKFTFLDYSGNQFRVPCYAAVGKGFSEDVKYIEITGVSRRSIRIDLNTRLPEEESKTGYHRDSLIFIGDIEKDKGSQVKVVHDPYNIDRNLLLTRDCISLDRARYESLLDDIFHETTQAIATSLSLSQSSEIVKVLAESGGPFRMRSHSFRNIIWISYIH